MSQTNACGSLIQRAHDPKTVSEANAQIAQYYTIQSNRLQKRGSILGTLPPSVHPLTAPGTFIRGLGNPLGYSYTRTPGRSVFGFSRSSTRGDIDNVFLLLDSWKQTVVEAQRYYWRNGPSQGIKGHCVGHEF